LSAPVTEIAHLNLARGYRGGERQTQLLIAELAERGWRQKLVARRGQPLAGACRDIAGLEVTEVSGNIISAALALGDARLVHVQRGRSLQAAYLNRVLRGIPYIVTRRVQKGPGRSLLNKIMYRQASGVVVLSDAISASLKKLDSGIETVRIPSATSNLSSQADEVAAIRERIGGDFVVGHVGAFVDAAKGQHQIIQVARRFALHRPSVRFVLVGDGADEARLKRKAEGLENLSFVGNVSNVGDYLGALDVFFYPSRHEGLGSILLDAMAFGLPVIATDVGGIPEIIEDQVNGMLCELDDIDALSAAVSALYDRPGLLEWMVEKNRETAQNYSPACMADRYESIYATLLER